MAHAAAGRNETRDGRSAIASQNSARGAKKRRSDSRSKETPPLMVVQRSLREYPNRSEPSGTIAVAKYLISAAYRMSRIVPAIPSTRERDRADRAAREAMTKSRNRKGSDCRKNAASN